jgi:hypothetical protein
MAKKQLIDYTKHQQELFKRIEGYAADVRAIYQDYFEQVIKLVKGTELVDGKPFSFSDYGYSQKVTPIFRKMYSRIYQTIRGGIQNEWLKSNENNDELVKAVFGKNSIEDNHFARFFVRNMEAMDSFFKRKSEYGGLNLSQRVWNYTGQYKEELENALDLAMGEGTPANRVSARVKQYLNDPDRFYRRFRVKTGDDDNGNPIYGRKWKRRIWDKASESYKWIDAEPKHYTPGKGIYRSSARNAQRLTRTETNMAYRTADQDRWQHMDFILGYRVKLSNNHPVTDICNDLSAANDDNESQRGVYPKDFVFKGWHPQCRCFVVPILANQADFIKMQKALLNGEELPQPSGIITEPNEHFKEWVKNNRGRIEKAKTLPYWVKDNKKAVEMAMASAVDDTDEALKAVAKAIGVEVGSPMTHEDADMLHPNPHYKEDVQYRVNCQSDVVAYELRRRGLPVEAFGNVKFSMGETLAHKTQASWVDSDGKMPTPIVCKQEIKNRYIDKRGYVRTTYSSENDVWQDFIRQTSGEGRYHIAWGWAGKDSGHIITMETFADGTRRFYDPQTGIEAKSILPWIIGDKKIAFDMKRGIRAYRVDNLQPNPLIVKGVVKKSGSTLVTPEASSEQIRWWLKEVKSSSVNSLGNKEKSLTQKYFEVKTNKERVQVLKNEIQSRDYKLVEGEKNIYCQYTIAESTQSEAIGNLAMAKKLQNQGYTVYMTSSTTSGVSGDFILIKDDKYFYVEAKQSTGKSSLDHNFQEGAIQADKVLVDVQTVRNTNYILGEITNAFNNTDVQEIWLLKKKRLIFVRRSDIGKNFRLWFAKEWEKRK